MSARTLRAATRGSPLALWQTKHVASLLNVDVELVVVETTGDKRRDVPIESIRGQGVFVKEVQTAVLEGRADFAVHSAKDLPSETADGLLLAAVPERGDPRDVIVGCALDDLPAGGAVATGSVRRRAQIASIRPDLTFHGLRGNIDTRLAAAKKYNAAVVAFAPLQRLGRDTSDAHVLEPSVMLPQVGQGALAAECRADDAETAALLASIEHESSRRAVDAERAFLAALGGGCDLPAAGYATVGEDGIFLRALLASLDGRIILRSRGTESDGVALGTRLAGELLDDHGGAALLMDHRTYG